MAVKGQVYCLLAPNMLVDDRASRMQFAAGSRGYIVKWPSCVISCVMKLCHEAV
jgi:hypothetical protein